MNSENKMPCILYYREEDRNDEHIITSMGDVSCFSFASPERTGDNEDAAAIIQTDEETMILAVADGVGGQPSGAQASGRLMQQIKDACLTHRKENLELRDALLSGIEKANREILGLNVGAATTLAAVEINKSYIRTYHVGDSAILLVGQKGKQVLETVLHSPTGYAVESGIMSEVDALHHEDRHIVSNVIGTKDMHISMSIPRKMKKFDTLFLATDGLVDNIDKNTIIETVRKGRLKDCLNRLYTMTRERMTCGDLKYKPDDTSCILFRRKP